MKETIVILHGWGLSGKKFLPLVKLLKNLGYTVFAPDLPGFGDSIMPTTPLHLVDYAQYLDEYLKDNKIKQAILVGHSFGGRVALLFQKLYPGRVKAIILSGTPGFSPINKRKLAFFIFLSKVGGAAFSLPILRLFKDWMRLKYYYAVGARDFYRAQGVMRETFKNIVREELIDSMRLVNIPCLLIWGQDDKICPVEIARKMKTVIPSAQLIEIPETDHAVPFKNPQLFVSHLNTFIKSL